MSEGSGSGRVVAGRYRLLAELGRGGMGVVWRARDEVLGREVAVKEVRAPNELDGRDVERLYARLEREGWAAARVSHRNVVTVHDVANEDGRPWIVMELVRGLTFADVLDAEGPLPPERAAFVGAEVLAALRAAHGSGVLHRDVKPGNVLMANDGRVVLTDFGIAVIEGGTSLTLTGELIGSPEFLAPERALGRTPGPESDLWSLGVMLYAAVEGRTPFRQDTPLSTMRAVVDDALPRPVRAGALTPVLEGLLRKDPALRVAPEEAERMLRVAAARGAPRAQGPPGAYQPTVVSGPPPAGPPAEPGRVAGTPMPSGSFGPPDDGAATRIGPGDGGRGGQRRRYAVLAAAALVAAVLAGGAAWTLLGDGGGDGARGAGSTAEPGGGGPADGTTNEGKDGSDSASGSGSGEGEGKGGDEGTGGKASKDGTPAGPTVTVRASAVRTHYTGACPPPAAEAPFFTGVIRVGRTPAEVEYRWAAGGYGDAGPGWKTLSFPGGGNTSRTVEHTVSVHQEGQTVEGWVALEVRGPRQAASGHLPFRVTCDADEETPTGGASSPYASSYGLHGHAPGALSYE